MYSLLSVFVLLLAMSLPSLAQNKETKKDQVFSDARSYDRLNFGSTEENKKTSKARKSRRDNEPKDRNYWQKQNTRKKTVRQKGKKNCDCPSKMTDKQRRKHRYQQ